MTSHFPSIPTLIPLPQTQVRAPTSLVYLDARQTFDTDADPLPRTYMLHEKVYFLKPTACSNGSFFGSACDQDVGEKIIV